MISSVEIVLKAIVVVSPPAPTAAANHLASYTTYFKRGLGIVARKFSLVTYP